MIDASTVYAAMGVLLFSMGLLGLVLGRHPVRKILALNVMGTGIFLFLVAAAARHGLENPDPVPHAMVLTGIVVAVSATALGLALASRIHRPSLTETDASTRTAESEHDCD
jgi:multicomponent Na+:H+ antiporter subunit C